MKTITITIIPGGLLIDVDGMAGFVINPTEVATEKYFLLTINQTATVCMN